MKNTEGVLHTLNSVVLTGRLLILEMNIQLLAAICMKTTNETLQHSPSLTML